MKIKGHECSGCSKYSDCAKVPLFYIDQGKHKTKVKKIKRWLCMECAEQFAVAVFRRK